MNPTPLWEDDDNNDEIPPPFAHITTLLVDQVSRPDVPLLRAIQKVQPDFTANQEDDFLQLQGGDWMDAIIVAADALYQRTSGKKYERQIVLWTDAAGHDVVLNVAQTLKVMDSLQAMDCPLMVRGIDFTPPNNRNVVKQEESSDVAAAAQPDAAASSTSDRPLLPRQTRTTTAPPRLPAASACYCRINPTAWNLNPRTWWRWNALPAATPPPIPVDPSCRP